MRYLAFKKAVKKGHYHQSLDVHKAIMNIETDPLIILRTQSSLNMIRRAIKHWQKPMGAMLKASRQIQRRSDMQNDQESVYM